jgi:hypothetical protein
MDTCDAMSGLNLSDVSHHYTETIALDHLSVEVARGEPTSERRGFAVHSKK